MFITNERVRMQEKSYGSEIIGRDNNIYKLAARLKVNKFNF